MSVVQAYVINLARSRDRRAHITAQLEKTGIGYEFVDAVDGRELDLSDSRLVDPVMIGNTSLRAGAGVPGVVGCALSHLRVYRKVLEDGLERALVLEDDMSLPSDLATLADSVGRDMVGAEVVLLSFSSPEPCRVTKRDSVPLPSSRLLVYPVDIRRMFSTCAYVITREACARMERFVLPVKTYPDDWALFCKERAIDRVRCVVPMPVATSPMFRSTIDHYQPSSRQGRLREWVSSVRVPILYQVLAYRRRRTFRRWGWTGEFEFVENGAVDSPGAGVR